MEQVQGATEVGRDSEPPPTLASTADAAAPAATTFGGSSWSSGAFSTAIAPLVSAVETAKGWHHATTGVAQDVIDDIKQRGKKGTIFPCVVCGCPTRGGDGGACYDADEWYAAPRTKSFASDGSVVDVSPAAAGAKGGSDVGAAGAAGDAQEKPPLDASASPGAEEEKVPLDASASPGGESTAAAQEADSAWWQLWGKEKAPLDASASPGGESTAVAQEAPSPPDASASPGAAEQALRPERCLSCLSAEERDLVVLASKRLHTAMSDFLQGKAEERHMEPEETRADFVHRCTVAALNATSSVLLFVPGASDAMFVTEALYGIVKYGPLALYQTEVADSVNLLVALASSSGVMPTGKDGAFEEKRRDCMSQNIQAVKETHKATSDFAELSAGLYYLLVERRNAMGLDPGAAEREHARCRAVDAAVLAELAEVLPLATTISYAPHAADAQRQLRLIKGSWQLVCIEPAGPGGQQQFILAVDRQARRAAVLLPGTRGPADLVTDLSAVPVRVPLGPGHCTGWVHRGMMRNACAVVRLVGPLLVRLEGEGFTTFFAGHSLGAGIASLAGLAMRLGLEGPRSDRVRSFGFATPAIGNGAVGKFCEAHAVTVVNCDDIVPRLSIETARKLRAELDGKREQVRKFIAEDVKALQDIKNIIEKKRRLFGIQEAESAAVNLENLGIPAPQDPTKTPKRPPGAAPAAVAPPAAAPEPPAEAAVPSPVVAAPSPVAVPAAAPETPKVAAPRRRFMFCLGGSLPKETVEQIEVLAPEPPQEPQLAEESEKVGSMCWVRQGP